MPDAYRNLLEPPALVRHFLAHPPSGFAALSLASGTPAFVAHFDLLTTADDALRRRVTGLPLYDLWGRLLRPRTCFVGTTVSEYALFPAAADADALVAEWLAGPARAHPFLIVKRDFAFSKTRYRGTAKNLHHLHMLFASANWLMRARAVALTG